MEGNRRTADSGVLGDNARSSLLASGADAEEIERFAVGFEVVTAGKQDDGSFRVSGIMNSGRIMYSGRMLHPAGFRNWLQQTSGGRPLPMLANHGLDNPTFATIGEWDEFKFVEGKGMVWSGRVGEGTGAADDARKLLGQKLLRQLSIGVVIEKGGWVSRDDADIDPDVASALDEAGRDRAWVATQYSPVEGSVVDVADDAGARIAAKANMAAIEAAVAPLKAEVQELRARVERMTAGRESPELAGTLEVVGEGFSEFLERWKDAALELLQTDPLVGAEAEAYRELHDHLQGGDDEPAGTGSSVEPSGDAELDELLQRVARGPGR